MSVVRKLLEGEQRLGLGPEPEARLAGGGAPERVIRDAEAPCAARAARARASWTRARRMRRGLGRGVHGVGGLDGAWGLPA